MTTSSIPRSSDIAAREAARSSPANTPRAWRSIRGFPSPTRSIRAAGKRYVDRTEIYDGIVLSEDDVTGKLIGLELRSYRPGDVRFDSVNARVGAARSAAPSSNGINGERGL